MFIKDVRKEFYEVIQQKHVLVIAVGDVDSVCACTILQNLFRWDHVSYTLVPITGLSELVRVVYEHSSTIKHVLLINCGANINLIDILQPPNDMIFFVIDSRRPVDLDNVFDTRQVRLIVKCNEFDEYSYPKLEDVYDEEDAEEEDEDLIEDSLQSPNKKRTKKKHRRSLDEDWIEKRNRLLFDYYEYSSHSTSSALILFDLAWKLKKDCNELLWCACVGLTSQLLEGRINASKYKFDSTDIQQNIHRLNHNNKAFSADCLKLHYENDLKLVLYRHWSLLESLKHTESTACAFRVWSSEGRKKLFHYLAVCGIPLINSKNKYSTLSTEVRKETRNAVEQNAEKFKLNELTFCSFKAQLSYVDKFSASDAAYSVAALLNFRDKKILDDNFHVALESLCKKNVTFLYEGIDLYKRFSEVLCNEVQGFLNTGSVIPSKVFLQCVLTQGSSGWKYFVNPYGLITLGKFLCRAYLQTSKGHKHKTKPLIIVVPSAAEEGYVLIAGLPPFSVQNEGAKPMNILGRAFQTISERTNCTMRQSYFDTSIVELKSEDRHKFCEALLTLIDVD